MFFLIKKGLGYILMPINMLFFCLFTGLALLLFTNKRQRQGKIICAVSFTALFLVCYKPFTFSLMKRLERTHPAYSSDSLPFDNIWVLGSGFTDDISIPVQSRICPEGMYRLLEGIRLYRLKPGARLIFSGYGGVEKKSVATASAEAAISLGIPERDILVIQKPRDTIEESIEAKKLLMNSKFILVTSASHMKRAIEIFRQQGLDPVPAPCGHYVKEANNRSLSHFLPSPDAAVVMNRYIYEQLGLLWLKIKNIIKSEPITSQRGS